LFASERSRGGREGGREGGRVWMGGWGGGGGGGEVHLINLQVKVKAQQKCLVSGAL